MRIETLSEVNDFHVRQGEPEELLLLAVGFFYRCAGMAFTVARLDVLTRLRATIFAPTGSRLLGHTFFGFTARPLEM